MFIAKYDIELVTILSVEYGITFKYKPSIDMKFKNPFVQSSLNFLSIQVTSRVQNLRKVDP